MGVTMWVVLFSFVSRFLVITPLVILCYKIRLSILSRFGSPGLSSQCPHMLVTQTAHLYV